MRFKNRLLKLESRFVKTDGEEEEEPRAAGKPRHVYILESIEWMKRRLLDPRRTEEERQSMLRQIKSMEAVYPVIKKCSDRRSATAQDLTNH